ncbi:acyltransferase family protein, partial [Candidatus Binatus sp.]|uniref:acyltransferase family protein n=2 Tax=Candidatus Binatus sp. TaxID=2811406 RepID=UPI003C94DA7D
HAALPMRKVPIDVMRAVSMLYIVGFWHLLDYTKGVGWHYNPVTYRLTVGALSLFVLISGFLTGRKDGGLARGEIWRFYETRFWRIYLPFVIASGLFLAAGMSDAIPLVKGVTLVAMLLAPPPFTLWFVNMIVLFYLIAPLLIRMRGNVVAYIGICLAIVGAMSVYQSEMGRIDMRLILYFPCFAAGIFLAAETLPSSTLSLIGLPLLAALSLLPTLTRESGRLENDLWAAPWALFASIAVFVVVMRAGRNLKPRAILTQLSEASFFMYLLHRPLYRWMQSVWFPITEKAQVPYLLFVCLPTIAIVAWFCQRAYTGLLERREVRVAAPTG